MPKLKSAKVPLCQVVGHDWRSTTSDNVKICMRGDCRIVAQKLHGHWRYIRKLDSKQLNRYNKGEMSAKLDVQEVAGLWEDIL